jgi:hypothetical protein
MWAHAPISDTHVTPCSAWSSCAALTILSLSGHLAPPLASLLLTTVGPYAAHCLRLLPILLLRVLGRRPPPPLLHYLPLSPSLLLRVPGRRPPPPLLHVLGRRTSPPSLRVLGSRPSPHLLRVPGSATRCLASTDIVSGRAHWVTGPSNSRRYGR